MLKIGLFQGNTTDRVGLSLKRFQTDHLPPTSSSQCVRLGVKATRFFSAIE